MKKYLILIALVFLITGCSKEIETEEINDSEINDSWPDIEYEGKYEMIETTTIHPKPDSEEKMAKILLTVSEGSAMFRESRHYKRHNVIYVREDHCFGASGEMQRRNITNETKYGFAPEVEKALQWPGADQPCEYFELVKIVDEKTVLINVNEWFDPVFDDEHQFTLTEEELSFWEPTWDYYIVYYLTLMEVQG